MQSLIEIILFFWFKIEQKQEQSEELFETTMTVETQQNHDRLIGGKNGMTANVNLSPVNSNGLKKTASSQQKQEEYKRMTENTMSVCNVNLMENNLASRYVCVFVFGLRAEFMWSILLTKKKTLFFLHFFCFSIRTICCSELRYDTLCKQVIRDMNMYGMCVVDDFLGMTHGLGILNEGNFYFSTQKNKL